MISNIISHSSGLNISPKSGFSGATRSDFATALAALLRLKRLGFGILMMMREAERMVKSEGQGRCEAGMS